MLRVFIRNMSSGKSIRTPIPVFGIEGRYVTALFSAASQSNQLEDVEKSLRALQKELTKPKVKDFIDTSMMSRVAKAKLLKDIASAAGMPSTAGNFLGLVAENGRLNMLRRIVQLYLSVMVAHRKEVHCEVITASPLQSDERDALMTALKNIVKGGKNIQLTEKVNESIIGGVIVGIDDKHIDLSISNKIMFYTELLTRTI